MDRSGAYELYKEALAIEGNVHKRDKSKNFAKTLGFSVLSGASAVGTFFESDSDHLKNIILGSALLCSTLISGFKASNSAVSYIENSADLASVDVRMKVLDLVNEYNLNQ